MSGGRAPEDCILRETKEETGLTLTSYRLRGVLTFMYNDDDAEMEYIFLYTADGFTGELADCNEGTLEWVPKTEINSLNLWEGDPDLPSASRRGSTVLLFETPLPG